MKQSPRSLDDLLSVALVAFAVLCSSALLLDTLSPFDAPTAPSAQA